MIKYEDFSHLPDEQNPALLYHLTHAAILVRIANGEIDAKQMAIDALASRGLDTAGKWVGFSKQ